MTTSPAWRKSNYSGSATTQSDCVEIAELGAGIGVRDSKTPDNGYLTLTPQAFAALVHHVKHTEPTS